MLTILPLYIALHRHPCCGLGPKAMATKMTTSFKLRTRQEFDGNPAKFILVCGPDLPLLLLNLFAISPNSGSFLVGWKHSVIIPSHDFSNYRHFNHTWSISRVMEKVAKCITVEYLLVSKFRSPKLRGFFQSCLCCACQFDFFK